MRSASWLFIASLTLSTVGPATAEAAGTFFLVEMRSGVGQSAYDLSDPGLTVGLAVGTTWKHKALPFRFHLLMNVAGIRSGGDWEVGGQRVQVERTDLDLYPSFRLAVPVWGGLRLYGEFGAGARWVFSGVERDGRLGRIAGTTRIPLIVAAGGAQVRVSRGLSVGLRVETTPYDLDEDLIDFATNARRIDNQVSAAVHVGLHF